MGDPKWLAIRKSGSLKRPGFTGPLAGGCATIGGRRKKLDKDFVAACRKLKALRVQAKKGFVGNRDWWDAPFSELADEYLDFIKAKKKPAIHMPNTNTSNAGSRATATAESPEKCRLRAEY